MLYEILEKFGKSKLNYFFAFLWGLAEGTLFFIIPDVYICFIALFSFSGGLYATIFVMIGSLLSSVIIFSLTPYLGSSYHQILLSIPAISEKMINQVTDGYAQNGIKEIIMGPLSGVPYKIYSVEAALHDFSLSQYLLWSIPARLERILPLAVLAFLIGYLAKNRIKHNPKLWIIGYIILWIIIYTIYFSKVS